MGEQVIKIFRLKISW